MLIVLLKWKKAYILSWISSSSRLFLTEDELFCYWILNAKHLSFASIHPFIECSFGYPCHSVDIIHFICICFLGIFTSSLPIFWVLHITILFQAGMYYKSAHLEYLPALRSTRQMQVKVPVRSLSKSAVIQPLKQVRY